MWFGTGSGLNRYDGRTFKVFRMPGISYRRIDRVVSLDTDYLLLRSEQNLFLFDKKYERFLPVCDSVSKQPVMFADFVADSDGSCWGVSSGELSEVNFPSSFVQDTAFVSVRHVVNNSQSDPFVVLCMGEDGKMLYCASRNGTVYRFTPGQRQLKKVCDGQLSSGRWVSSLLNDDSFIWIPTVGDGLYGYDLTNGKLHHWQYISERMGEQLSHNDVFRLLPIGNSRYLAVTWNGYTLLSLTPERAIKLRDFQSFIHNGKQYFETRMISGYYDEEGLLWIGTEGGGVLFSDLRQLFYHQYAQTRSNEICGIQMDEDGYVWLATFHKGVLRSTQPFDVSHSLSFESFDTGIPGLKTVLCSSPDKNGGFGSVRRTDGCFVTEKTGNGMTCGLALSDSLLQWYGACLWFRTNSAGRVPATACTGWIFSGELQRTSAGVIRKSRIISIYVRWRPVIIRLYGWEPEEACFGCG